MSCRSRSSMAPHIHQASPRERRAAEQSTPPLPFGVRSTPGRGAMRRLLIGVGFLAGGCAQDSIGVRTSAIVGGGPTSEYPAVLLLQRPDGAFCTGTLVAPDVVLTAAHCGLTSDWTA